MRKMITGYCPETDTRQTVVVDIKRIVMAGGMPAGYKAMSVRCPYADEHGCHYGGTNNLDCPLAKKDHD